MSCDVENGIYVIVDQNRYRHAVGQTLPLRVYSERTKRLWCVRIWLASLYTSREVLHFIFILILSLISQTYLIFKDFCGM